MATQIVELLSRDFVLRKRSACPHSSRCAGCLNSHRAYLPVATLQAARSLTQVRAASPVQVAPAVVAPVGRAQVSHRRASSGT